MTHLNSRFRRNINWRRRDTRRVLLTAAFILALLTLALPALNRTRASNPTGGTINPTATTPVTWTGTAIAGGALNAPVGIGGEDLCQEGITCDTFTLTVGGTTADWSGKLIHIKIEWMLPVTDYDFYIYTNLNYGEVVVSSARRAPPSERPSPWQTNPITYKDTTIDPSNTGTGVYTIHAVYYLATAADQYHGSATIEAQPAPQPTPSPSTDAAPRYQNYPAPPALGNSAGEPSIGVNWDTGTAMFIASL